MKTRGEGAGREDTIDVVRDETRDAGCEDTRGGGREGIRS